MSCACSGMREKVSSRQAISIMCHRPDTTVGESVSTVVLYMHRDGCCNQNRNVTLSNDVAGYASAKKKAVFQRFLEKGHTFIEVDSVQSVIENKMRGREIFWPAEYVWLTSCTCQDLSYLVKQVDHVSFKDYSKLSHLSSCRPGISLGNPQVVDLRCLQYHPDGSTVSYKLNYSNLQLSHTSYHSLLTGSLTRGGRRGLHLCQSWASVWVSAKSCQSSL